MYIKVKLGVPTLKQRSLPTTRGQFQLSLLIKNPQFLVFTIKQHLVRRFSFMGNCLISEWYFFSGVEHFMKRATFISRVSLLSRHRKRISH